MDLALSDFWQRELAYWEEEQAKLPTLTEQYPNENVLGILLRGVRYHRDFEQYTDKLSSFIAETGLTRQQLEQYAKEHDDPSMMKVVIEGNTISISV